MTKRPSLKEIFISATIHQENEPSKRVTTSFGKFDTLYIKRRTGINREVYFCRIDTKNLQDYIRKNEEKIEKLKDIVYRDSNVVIKTIEI